jgi:exonuclease III
MTGITTYLSILTLNVNGLNSTIKRHHLEKWIKKEDPTICSYRTPISLTETRTGLE